VGVEIGHPPLTAETTTEIEHFVYQYLSASIQGEDDGGRMRWYPWHSAEYRFAHIQNVVELATAIAEAEGADTAVVHVAALFHDIAKLEVEQDRHAAVGARVARKFLNTREGFTDGFISAVTDRIEQHSYEGPLEAVDPELQTLVEADILDKIGANGTALMLLRMGYEARTHTEAAEMVDLVIDRGEQAAERVVSPTAQALATERLRRVQAMREWLADEVAVVATGD
jgi:uncharacterized domain HDIG